ncbi:MAG: hypothetical protein RSD47_09035 [Romboutsia sp.]
MSTIKDLNIKAMDIAIEIVTCKKYESESEIKEFKLNKLNAELEIVKKETEELLKHYDTSNTLNITPFDDFFKD